MRSKREVTAAEQDAFDAVWLDRQRAQLATFADDDVAWEGLRQVSDRVIERHGEAGLRRQNPLALARLEGRLEALRWVLGDDWGNFDT